VTYLTELTCLELLPIPKDAEIALEALGRKGCPDVCLVMSSPKPDEWKGFSDIYYELVKQTRLPWATYNKLIRYMVEQEFVEKNVTTVKNRKAILLRLTEQGRRLAKMYLTLHKHLGELGFKLDTPAQAATE